MECSGRTEVTRIRGFGEGFPRLRILLAFSIPTAALVAGCAGVRVHQHASLDRTNAGMVNATTPPPQLALDLLRDGLVVERVDPRHAIRSYRESALKALPYAMADGEGGSDGDGVTGARLVYRRAIEYAIQAADRVSKAESVRWTDVLAGEGIAVQGMVSAFAPNQWDDALPTRAFEVSGFHQHIARDGLGAPLVLSRDSGDPKSVPDGERYFPKDLQKAATAVLVPARSGYGKVAVLELIDPVRDPDMRWVKGADGRSLPLAYDMTTPLARQFSSKNISILGPLGVLLPDRITARTGMYMQDPYQPGKIPLVFVHGLASGPQAWADAVNELRGDPELRKRYQFWLFYYTTGNPILGSAARFRESLNKVRDEFDPEHKDPALDRMVLVGHSMGGLLSRLSVVSSGQEFWKLASKLSPDEIDIEPELKKRLVSALVFEPVPSVDRVVFISTPHQGSPLGYNIVGQLASSMIRLPQAASELSKSLVKAVGIENVPPEFRNRRELTGVRQLASGNPVLAAMNRVPFDDKVKYHSIVGFNGRGDPETGGDGVVPYTSAHVEGAVSELIVKSDHSAQEKEPAIAELHRILLEHLGESAGDRPAGPTPIRYANDPAAQSDPISRKIRTKINDLVR